VHVWADVSTAPFYIRDSSTHELWCLRWSWNQAPVGTRNTYLHEMHVWKSIFQTHTQEGWDLHVSTPNSNVSPWVKD
jgi:hypothetical protein